MNITTVSLSEVPSRIPVSRMERESFSLEDDLVIAVAQTAGTATAIKIEGLTVGVDSSVPLNRVTFRSWQVKLRNKLAARHLSCSFRFDAGTSTVYAWAYTKV